MGQIILVAFLAFVSVFLVPVSLSDRALAIEQASFEPPVIFGIVNNPSRNNVNCKIDFVNKTLNLLFDFKERGSADIKGNIDSKGRYSLNVALRHFKLGRADILTDFQTTGFLAYSKDGKLNIGRQPPIRALDVAVVYLVDVESGCDGIAAKVRNGPLLKAEKNRSRIMIAVHIRKEYS